MKAYIDTNVIVRYLVQDQDSPHFQESLEIIKAIKTARREVVILESVLMQCLFVLIKYYELPKAEVVEDLKRILTYEGIVNSDKFLLIKALEAFVQNSDIVDCLVYVRAKDKGYGVLTFDEKLKKLCKKIEP